MSIISEELYPDSLKQALGNKASHRDLAYGIVRREILLGRMKHGTKINECQLAEKLGISRTPVREALLRLHGEGIVSKSRGGLKVTKMSPKETERQIEFRTIIECAAVRLACLRITTLELERLQEVVDHQKILTQPKDQEAFLEADLTFHHLILKATDNPFFIRMSSSLALGQLHMRVDIDEEIVIDGQRRYVHTPSNASVVTGHQHILDALKERNADKAEKLMYAHVSNGIFDIENNNGEAEQNNNPRENGEASK